MGTHLGQNFLIDTKIQNYIADRIGKIYQKHSLYGIVEIGPGRGAISKKIYKISSNFFVVEKDIRMKSYLEIFLDSSSQIYFNDVLKFDVSEILKSKNLESNKILIVGNLPYYITSPIFRTFFANGTQKYFGGFFMVQDELGQKIKTDATKKSFLRWILNYSYDINYCKKVSPKSFNPVPKVNSCLLEFVPKKDLIDLDFDKLIIFLDLYSSFNRKTLGAINKIIKKQNNTNFTIPKELLKKRLEELSWEDLKTIL